MNLERISDVPRAGANGCQEKTFLRRKILSALARCRCARPIIPTRVMNARTDAFLRDVIAKGGKAMGLSSFMPAWQGIFKDNEIQDLVGYIRSLALPAK